jgi:hypothetical protein
VFTVKSTDNADTRAAAVFLTTDIISPSATSNQVGYLVLQEGETWDPSAITLEKLKERFQVLGGSLENTNLPQLGNGMKFQRDLQFTTGDRILFLEVVDGTMDDLAQSKANASIASLNSQISILELSGTASENNLLLKSPTSGLQLQLTLQTAETGLSGFLARQQGDAPLLDLTGLGGMTVQGTLEIAREAAFNSTVGFYRVLDASGTVEDPLTGNKLRPDDDGYQQAALHKENLFSALGGLTVGNFGLSSRELAISPGWILAPYAVVDSGQDLKTYFAYNDANQDRVQHFQMLGDNTWGLEDFYGGGDRDFDDLIVTFQPTGLIPPATA